MNSVRQYERIKSFILSGITQGKWTAGARLPSEHQLADQFALSRMTVNRAIKELQSDGIVNRIRGKGTFVAPPKPLTSVLKIEGIDREIIARGNTYHCEVIALKSVRASTELAARLEIEKDSKLYFSSILHFENGIPIQFAQRWLLPSLAPHFLDQDFSIQTPHEYLMEIAPFTHGEHTIEACMPGSRIRNRLELADNEPALLIHRRTWVHESLVTYVKLFHSGNRFQITTQLSR